MFHKNFALGSENDCLQPIKYNDDSQLFHKTFIFYNTMFFYIEIRE